ncbi:hypothetical protein [Aestuariivirga sp.]|uniref:hypothetical protein n=1 Tax=Aestuariivirga sp. TaxID=2650926 RepID=UPI0039E64576
MKTLSFLQVFMLLIFCTFGAVSNSSADVPASVMRDPTIFWKVFMRNFYGNYNKAKKCWLSKHEGQLYCMRPHKLDTVSVGAQKLYFVVAGGERLDDQGEPQNSHADSGVLGLVVLTAKNGALGEIAQNSLYQDFGSFGALPLAENFKVRELGPNGNYGWTVDNGWAGMGIDQESTTIFASIGDTVTKIGVIPLHFDERGNCDESGKNIQTGKTCSDYSFELLFDAQELRERFYPIILKLSGSREGIPLDRTFQTTFDMSKFRYADIAGLPDEFGTGDSTDDSGEDDDTDQASSRPNDRPSADGIGKAEQSENGLVFTGSSVKAAGDGAGISLSNKFLISELSTAFPGYENELVVEDGLHIMLTKNKSGVSVYGDEESKKISSIWSFGNLVKDALGNSIGDKVVRAAGTNWLTCGYFDSDGITYCRSAGLAGLIYLLKEDESCKIDNNQFMTSNGIVEKRIEVPNCSVIEAFGLMGAS